MHLYPRQDTHISDETSLIELFGNIMKGSSLAFLPQQSGKSDQSRLEGANGKGADDSVHVSHVGKCPCYKTLTATDAMSFGS